MVAFVYRMDTGYPGITNRQHDCTVEAQVISSVSPPPEYGIGVVIDAATGQIRAPVAGDPPAPGGMVYGLYVKPYPTQGSTFNDPLGAASPPVAGIGNVLKRGYMTVKLRGAAAAVKNGPVYIWKAPAGGGQIPGGITADGSTPANVMVLPGYFMGPADANGITEVALNI